MTTKSPRTRAETRLALASLEIRAEGDLPPGFCGVVQGVALPYDTVDGYGTMFAPGCLDKTRAQKVAGRKVKLFVDHDYAIPTHVGTILSLEDVGGAAVMTAGILDTKEGREVREYLLAITASGSSTGLSVGFYERASEWVTSPDGVGSVLRYLEVELIEVSLTPRQAVPGAEVTGVRSSEAVVGLLERSLRGLCLALPAARVRAIVEETLAASPPVAPDSPSAESNPLPPDDASSSKTNGDAEPPAPDTGKGSADVTYATPEQKAEALRSTYRTRA